MKLMGRYCEGFVDRFGQKSWASGLNDRIPTHNGECIVWREEKHVIETVQASNVKTDIKRRLIKNEFPVSFRL